MERTLYSGWVRKRPQGLMGYFLQKRFLVLTNQRLCYFEEEPTSGTAIIEGEYDPKRQIYLKLLTSVSRAGERGGMLVVTAERSYTLVFGSDPERDEWLAAILAGRESTLSDDKMLEPAVAAAASCVLSEPFTQNSPSKSRNMSTDSSSSETFRKGLELFKYATDNIVTNVSSVYGSIKATVENKLFGGEEEEEREVDNVAVGAADCTIPAYPKMNKIQIIHILRLEHTLRELSYKESCLLIGDFFDSLYKMPSSQRSDIAKKLGQSLVLWFGSPCIGLDVVASDETAAPDIDLSGCLFSRKEYHSLSRSQRLILPWIEVSLRRELQKSCPILYQSNSGVDINDSSESNTFRPFRADYPETLLLSNICRAACFQTGILTAWLSPLLLCIGQCPEDYIQKKVAMSADSSYEPVSQEKTDPNLLSENRFNMCKLIVERMCQQGRDELSSLPPFVSLLLQCVKRETLRGDNQEVFHAAMVAILFLRLVCPALISPKDSGILSAWNFEKVSVSKDYDDTYRSMDTFVVSSPAIILISHTFMSIPDNQAADERKLFEMMNDICASVSLCNATNMLDIVRSSFFLVPSVSSTISLEDTPRKASCIERPDLTALSEDEVFIDDLWQFDEDGHWLCTDPLSCLHKVDAYLANVEDTLEISEVRIALLEIAKMLQQFANAVVVGIVNLTDVAVALSEQKLLFDTMKELFVVTTGTTKIAAP